MKYTNLIPLYLILLSACSGECLQKQTSVKAEADTLFAQPISIKYELVNEKPSSEFTKLCVDNNDAIYLLAGNKLYREFPDQKVAVDRTYSYLQDKRFVDISTQEKSGFLYMLLDNEFLTNAHAGSIYAFLPKDEYRLIAVNSKDEILLIGKSKATLYNKCEKKTDLPLPTSNVKKAYALFGSFFMIADNTLYRLEEGASSWKTICKAEGLTSASRHGDNIALATNNGYMVVSQEGKEVEAMNANLPVPAVTDIKSINNQLWFASDQGAFNADKERWNGFRYWASKRWLDNDTVVSIEADSKGNIYLLSQSGLNKIAFEPYTLAQKADWFEDNLRKYHIRHGFSSVAGYYTAGDFTTHYLWDTENDALWGSFWLTAMAFKYATTGDERALQACWEAFEGFERLHTINEIPGYMSRSFNRTGYSRNPKSQRLRVSEVDPNWEWKGDSSTDEFCGYLFLAAVMDELIAKTPEEKRRVADLIVPIMDHILKNDYHMIDRDGKPDIWGYWHNDYTNQYTWHQFDRRLQPTHLIAGLQLAYHFTKDEKYKEAAYFTFNEWGYLDNIRKLSMKDVKWDTPVKHYHYTLGEDYNHSDDEMAFFAYWPLYKYAFNDSLKQDWAWAIKDHYDVEIPERHALWNAITHALIGESIPKDITWHLRELPLDNNTYAVKNSHRKDIQPIYETNKDTNFRGQSTKEMLPWNEVPKRRHNANPFDLDGGVDWGDCFAGDEYLLPYWMGRYLGLIR